MRTNKYFSKEANITLSDACFSNLSMFANKVSNLDDVRRIVNNIDMRGYPCMTIKIVDKHDDGEQVRKHKKKRINKKWLKRYGVYHSLLKTGEVVVFDNALLMTKSTYNKFFDDIPKIRDRSERNEKT